MAVGTLQRAQEMSLMQQCLGRDATPVQTDTTQLLSALDQRHTPSLLRGANRPTVTAWATADDDEIVG